MIDCKCDCPIILFSLSILVFLLKFLTTYNTYDRSVQMGYGEYESIVIYGWCEAKDNKIIDSCWLEDAELESYGIGTSKGYTLRFAYGIHE